MWTQEKNKGVDFFFWLYVFSRLSWRARGGHQRKMEDKGTPSKVIVKPNNDTEHGIGDDKC
jgi:hypothetical protein